VPKLAVSVDQILGSLNEPQKKAVTHEGTPLLVLAGAGSGKTRVLTHRIAHLIASGRMEPWQFLAVTFTNKAAREMKRRVEGLVGPDAQSMHVGTFHRMCLMWLRREVVKINRDPNFSIFDDSDQRSLVKKLLRRMGFHGDQDATPARCLNRISSRKTRLLNPADPVEDEDSLDRRVINELYPMYQEALRQANALDFDDLIRGAVELFRKDPETREKYRRRYRHILVDEYQDTNFSQAELVRLLAGDGENLCVVGDEDQSIFGWRGAEIQNVLEFGDTFPDMTMIRLEENYRSKQKILDAANSVVRNNKLRLGKDLWSSRGPGGEVHLVTCLSDLDEAARVVGEIRRCSEEGEISYREVAVLYRTNSQSRLFEDELRRHRMPYVVVGGRKFYDRKEIKDILAYLKILVNPSDNISLDRILNVPNRAIGQRSVEALNAHASSNSLTLFGALGQAAEVPGLAPRAKKAIAEFTEMVDELREDAHTLTVAGIVDRALDRSGYRRHLEEEGTREARDRMANLEEFISAATEYDEGDSEEKSLVDFLQELALITDLDIAPEEEGSVNLMTIHNAKGLEFPVIFLVGLEDGLLPHINSETDEEYEEERRLCYVAMTRAKDRLYLTWARRRNLFGTHYDRDPSPFLFELPDEIIESGMDESDFGEISDRPDNHSSGKKMNFRVGDLVYHDRFGRGTILYASGKGDQLKVNVKFDGDGRRRELVVKYAPLVRV